MLLGNVAEALADVYGDRPALAEEGVGTFTFRELAEGVERLASGVADRTQPGVPVGIALRNGVPLFMGILGVARAGRIPVPLNPELRTSEVVGVLDETGAGAVLVEGPTASIAPRGTSVLDVDAFGDVDGGTAPLQGDAGDVAAIFSTSGTTGRSKGAELTHRGLLTIPLAGLAVGGALNWTMLEALPVAHIMGFTALLGSLAAGMEVRAMERFHPVRFLEEAAAHRPDVVTAVPTMYRMILDARSGPDAKEALSSVRVFACGSDVLPAPLAKRIRGLGATGAVLVEGYGMVELSGAVAVRVHAPVLGPVPRGDLGFPVPPFRVRVVDDRGRPVLPFRVGNLEVRGPGVLAGYRNRPDASEEAIHDGWLRTGDLASWSPSGLRFAGRSKDVVKVGGYSVYPSEVEEELRGCPGVADIAVVGLPDPMKGAVLGALVERDRESSLAASDVEAFATTNLAAYRRPGRVIVVDELPRNANQKVVKEHVAALFS